MEVLGRQLRGVVSLSGSAGLPTGFASLSSTGEVSLWDTRLKNKCYVTVGNSTKHAHEASEILFLADTRSVLALCGPTCQVFDLRRAMAPVKEYDHSTELMSFLSHPVPPTDASEVLVIDENGAILSLSAETGAPTSKIPEYVLGHPYELPSSMTFGSLSNISSGFGVVETAEERGSPRALFALGMDSQGYLFSSPSEAAHPFTVEEEDVSGNSVQVVNPPLPTCCGFMGNRIVIGRANGWYSIAEVQESEVAEVMSAPGHASNGLCYVDWTTEQHALTVSLCGELTVWDVNAFIAAALDEEAAEEEEEGSNDLPEVKYAAAHREATGSLRSVVNCCARISLQTYVLGDTEGFLSCCTL